MRKIMEQNKLRIYKELIESMPKMINIVTSNEQSMNWSNIIFSK